MNRGKMKPDRKTGKGPPLTNGHGLPTSSAKFSNLQSVELQSVSYDSENNGQEDFGLDLHLDLDQLDDMSEDSDEWESESEEELQNMHKNTNQNHPNGATAGVSDPENDGTLVPYDDGGIDVDSEEEREIMKEIKNEITDKIRGEMKSELALYKAKVDALENGEILGGDAPKKDNEEGLEDVEPKLKEAIIKMRKLDRILSKKVAREKQVKRDRILLERRIKHEIKELKTGVKKENQEEKVNTAKYLSLTLPPRHNEGVEIPKNLPSEPVFTTQLNEQDYPGVHGEGGTTPSESQTSKRTQRMSGASSQQDTNSELGSETSSMFGDGKGKRRKKKKNFIKRNKELAGEAENPIPMTDEEKKRLDGLLDDIESLPEILDEEIDPTASSNDLSNPYQIVVKAGEGFYPEANEQRSLSHIDSRLRELLPPDEYESVASSSSVGFTSPQKLFTPVGYRSGLPLDYERFGEKALLETKEQRDMQERLLRIEDELSKLHSNRELELPETPSQLGEDQLKDLLDQCVRSMSRSTQFSESEDNTPRSPTSARETLLENPPHLPPATLQKLLADAYCPASRLSTLREEEEEDKEDGGYNEPIDAETWKLIAQERLDDEDDEEYQSHLNTMRSSLPGLSEINSRSNSRNQYYKATPSYEPNTIRSENCDSRTRFLPEINRSGSLVASQDWNNSRPSSIQSNRSSVITVHNSFDSYSSAINNIQDGTEVMSINGDTPMQTPVPVPPSGDKRTHSSQSNKSSRIVTPVNKSLS